MDRWGKHVFFILWNNQFPTTSEANINFKETKARKIQIRLTCLQSENWNHKHMSADSFCVRRHWFIAFLQACFQLWADNDYYLEIIFYFQAYFASKTYSGFPGVLLIRNIPYSVLRKAGGCHEMGLELGRTDLKFQLQHFKALLLRRYCRK